MTSTSFVVTAVPSDAKERMTAPFVGVPVSALKLNVPVTPQGGLTFEDGISAPGKYVELRAKCNVIVLISNCPQLNNPCNGWNPTPAEVLVWN